METRPVVIAPQKLHLPAPLPYLHAVLGSQHGMLYPASGTPWFSYPPDDDAAADIAGTLSTMQVVYQTATRIVYRQPGGTFTDAWQELSLEPAGDGTDLLLTTGCFVSAECSLWMYQRRWEQAARAQLLSLAAAVFEQTTGSDRLQDLRALADMQEEVEWGHRGHSLGVEALAVGLAQSVMLPERQLDHLRLAAQLHDLGKIALDRSLWIQQSMLTAGQRAALEIHAQMGALIAARAGVPDPVLATISYHHERWDGRGYPLGLAGQDIPLRARILFLAEAIDSMQRPSLRRPALPTETVVARLEAGAGRAWDPLLVPVATRLLGSSASPRFARRILRAAPEPPALLGIPGTFQAAS